MVKDFGYLKQIIQCVKKGKPFPVLRINEIGGRMGSKTYSSLEAVIIMCLIAKVKVDGFRWTKGKDRKEFFDQVGAIISSFPGLTEKIVIHKSNKTYTFPNGSIIEISGLRTMGSKDVQLTGKSGMVMFDYQIAIAEERYEISDSAWGDVLQAIRGTGNFMEMHLANPWVFTNDFVKYCNDNLKFDLQQLIDKGQQFAIKEKEIKLMGGETFKYKEIFHYSNYSINHHLSTLDKVKLEMAAKHDPHRANTILYGFPGAPKGGIWKWVLPKMKQIQPEPSVKYVGGVDYGERNDATTAYIVGFNSGNSHSHIEHEYYHKNRDIGEYKNTQDLAEDVVDHYLDFLEERQYQGTMDVWVDGSAIPFITALNATTQSLGYDRILKFWQQTNKQRVADRIETMKTLASYGMITVDPDCVELLRELNEQVYSDKSRTSIDYVEGDDHATDAIYYGIVTEWVELLENMEYKATAEAEAEAEKITAEAEKEVNNGNR